MVYDTVLISVCLSELEQDNHYYERTECGSWIGVLGWTARLSPAPQPPATTFHVAHPFGVPEQIGPLPF